MGHIEFGHTGYFVCHSGFNFSWKQHAFIVIDLFSIMVAVEKSGQLHALFIKSVQHFSIPFAQIFFGQKLVFQNRNIFM